MPLKITRMAKIKKDVSTKVWGDGITTEALMH